MGLLVCQGLGRSPTVFTLNLRSLKIGRADFEFVFYIGVANIEGWRKTVPRLKK